MNVEIRKGHGIDHLVGGYSPGKVEEEKELASNPFFVSLFAKYEKAVYEDLVRLWQMDFILGENYVDEVLLPKQINAFLQATIQYMRPGYHFTENTAVFINKLIQNSYSAGNNGFHLNLPVTDLLCVGSHLQGKKERPIELHVKGRAGAFSGWSSEYLNLSVEWLTIISLSVLRIAVSR